MIKSQINKILAHFGYEIKRAGWSYQHLQQLLPAVKTVIDVGAGYGTLELYKAFPQAEYILIEPLQEYEPYLKKILTAYRGSFIVTAVGSEEGKVTMHVAPDQLVKSSIYDRTALTTTNSTPQQRLVSLTTLDTLYANYGWRPPFGLKIDTEGFEREVIQGATQVLQQTLFVIAEVSVAKRFTEGYHFAEFIKLMEQSGFYLVDILQIVGKPALYLDAVFTRSKPSTT